MRNDEIVNVRYMVDDVDAAIAFYTKLLGKPIWDQGGYVSWQIGTGNMTVGPHDQVHGTNTEPGRLIWNIESDDVKGEFERLKAADVCRTAQVQPYVLSTWEAEFPDLDQATDGLEEPRIFLKMDTQGYDLATVRGAGDRLGDVLALQSEVSCLPIYDGMPRMTEQLLLFGLA